MESLVFFGDFHNLVTNRASAILGYHKPCVEPAGGHCSTIEELQQLLTAVADFERKYSYRVEVIFVGLTGTGQRMDPKYKSSKYNQRPEQLLEYSDALLSRLMKWNRDVAKASPESGRRLSVVAS